MKPESVGLCGQSFTLRTATAAAQMTKNWYPSVVDDPNEKERIVLNPCPGLSVFSTIGSGPYRGQIYALDSRLYVVSLDRVYAITTAGVITDFGAISNSNGNQPVSMTASDTQLMIIADGLGYYIQAGVLTQIVDVDFPASVLVGLYSDGYFIAITARRIYTSALNDVTSWDALDFNVVQASTNDLVTGLVVQRRLVVLGTEIGQIFDNTGNTDFPYEADPASILAYGCAARFGAGSIPGQAAYVATDSDGNGLIVDLAGRKVSTDAVDFALQEYSTLSDAVVCAFQLDGHHFVQFTFPSANATWRFDVSTGFWHQAEYWNTDTGQWNAHLGLFHTFAFGRHLMGSRVGASLFELSLTVYTDDGAPIRRLRRSPHVRVGHQRVFYNAMRMIMDVGVGLDVASGTAGYDPQLVLRYSDNGGKTGLDQDDIKDQISIGKIGEFWIQPAFNRLGSAYDRIFEIEGSDPVPYRIADVLVEYEVGTS